MSEFIGAILALWVGIAIAWFLYPIFFVWTDRLWEWRQEYQYMYELRLKAWRERKRRTQRDVTVL